MVFRYRLTIVSHFFNASYCLSSLSKAIKLYFLKDERRSDWLLTFYFHVKRLCFIWIKNPTVLGNVCTVVWGLSFLPSCSRLLACLEGCRLLYCHAGLDIGAFDVALVSSGNLCHFLFLMHYLTSFAVSRGIFSRLIQQIRENN